MKKQKYKLYYKGLPLFNNTARVLSDQKIRGIIKFGFLSCKVPNHKKEIIDITLKEIDLITSSGQVIWSKSGGIHCPFLTLQLADVIIEIKERRARSEEWIRAHT